MPKVQAEFFQLLAHFRQSCLTKITDFQQLIFIPLNEVAHRIDVLRLQAIARPNRQDSTRPDSCSAWLPMPHRPLPPPERAAEWTRCPSSEY